MNRAGPGIVHIRPGRQSVGALVRELWAYRELFYFFSWRDVAVRYKQTILGVAWAVVQPLCNVLIFSIFFGRLAGMPSDGVPYTLFALCGIVPWLFFSNGLTLSANCLLTDANLLKKIYFPRIILPVASLGPPLLDLLFSVLIVGGASWFYGVHWIGFYFLLPLWFVVAWMTVMGFGLLLSALNVLYRDVKHIIPFLIQLWMFVSPVVYPASMIPEKWRMLYAINPLVGVVEGFRMIVMGPHAENPLPAGALIVSISVSMLAFLAGFLFFNRTQRHFADIA